MLDAGARRTERIGRILRVQADRHTEVDRAVAGDIVAVVGLKAARAGRDAVRAGGAAGARTADGRPIRSSRWRSRRARSTDTDRLASALARLVEEDPSLVGPDRPRDRPDRAVRAWASCTWRWRWRRSAATTGWTSASAGRRWPTGRRSCAGCPGCVYRHVKQDGGAGPVRPRRARRGAAGRGRATGFAFRSTVVGGRVPQEYVRAVEAGCRDALAEGPLGGHPVTGLRVTLTDGATHSEGLLGAGVPHGRAARAAGGAAGRRDGAARTGGRGHGHRARRRRRRRCSATWRPAAAGSSAPTPRAGTVVVTATVPLAELFGYATRLRSRTQGRGTFTTRPAGYAPAPGTVPVS